MASRTALITGASQGIGERLAHLFARDGHSVVLVARSSEKLEAVAAQLREKPGIQAHVIVADLNDPKAPKRVYDETVARGLTIDFLVNNAGFGSNGPFLDIDLDVESSMVEVNVATLMKMSHRFGKPMRDRGFGRMLNIASTAGFQPGPFMATYYATKAFVLSFSLALSYELRGTGVTVSCHCPGATHTGFAARSGNDKSRLFQRKGVSSAEEVALDAYKTMMSGRELKVFGAMNRIAAVGARLSPLKTSTAIAGKLNQPPS